MRGAVTLAAALVLAAVPAGAGDDKQAPKPPLKESTPKFPKRLLRSRPTLKDLKPGQSARIPADVVHATADGGAWISPRAYQLREGDYLPALSPVAVKAEEGVFDLDLTGCDRRWAQHEDDGSRYVPAEDEIRVRQFLRQGDPPSTILPERNRGEMLWKFPPDTTVFVSARDLGADDRGQSWIDPCVACARERFEDSCGPALAVTTSERPVVKVDLTGSTWRRRAEPFPDVFTTTRGPSGQPPTWTLSRPYGVTSFRNGLSVLTRMPPELMEPLLRDLAPGRSGFVECWFVRVDPRGRAWVDAAAPVSEFQRVDQSEYAFVKIAIVDKKTCVLDLAGTTRRWCVADGGGQFFPDTLEKDGHVAWGTSWLRAVEVRENGAGLGETLPERCRAERIWQFAPGTTVYASCRMLLVDPELKGRVSARIPVCRATFADDLGNAMAITLADVDDTCFVDLTGTTARWEVRPAPDDAPIEKPRTPGPKRNYLSVAEFTVEAPPAAPPPGKPEKPGKPPKKK